MPGAYPGSDYQASEFAYISQNGNNDDGPAINQALTYINGQGGGRLLFSPGVTIRINTSIKMPSKTEISLPTSTTLQAGTTLVGPVIQNLDQVNGNTGIHISGGGAIDGNRPNVASSATDCINLAKCVGAAIFDISVFNAYRDGINLTSCDRPIIRPKVAFTNGRDGVRCTTCTFPLFHMPAFNNGQRIAGNGVTFATTSTDGSGIIEATDNQGSPTQQYGIQELAASGCNRNVFVGSCNGNVIAGSSFIGAASQLFTQPSLSSPTITTPTITSPTITGTVAGGATFTNPTLAGALMTGRLQRRMGAGVTAANNLTLGTDGDSFQISGTTQINLISETGWQNGSDLTLYFFSSVTVKNGQVASGSFDPIMLSNSTDFSAITGSTLTLKLFGGFWIEIGRKV